LSWVITNEKGEVITKHDCIIKPEGFTIKPSATKVHGITTEHALSNGYDLSSVLNIFIHEITEHNPVLVAHNFDFDFNIVWCEMERTGVKISPEVPLDGNYICTMKALTEFVGIPNWYGYKWPSLQELHFELFNEGFENAHNSLADVMATKDCFFKAMEIEQAKSALERYKKQGR
jgi:DNA polymerase III epsilon subunit-like protein